MPWNGLHRLQLVLASAAALAVTATVALAHPADLAVDPDAWRRNYSALEARVTQPDNLAPLLADIRGRGGHVGVIVPPVSYPGVATYLGWWADGSLQPLLGQHGVAAIYAPRSAGVSAAAHATGALHFWHAAVTGTLPARAATTGADAWQPAAEPRALVGDARDPGDRLAAGHSLRDGPGGPVTNGTSDQMIGTVTTALFLVESNGGLDPNTYTWTPADSATEVNGVLAAMSWWSSSALTYGQSVTFTLLTYGASSATCQTQYDVSLELGLQHFRGLQSVTRTRAVHRRLFRVGLFRRALLADVVPFVQLHGAAGDGARVGTYFRRLR